jgi:hypothetical protein
MFFLQKRLFAASLYFLNLVQSMDNFQYTIIHFICLEKNNPIGLLIDVYFYNIGFMGLLLRLAIFLERPKIFLGFIHGSSR